MQEHCRYASHSVPRCVERYDVRQSGLQRRARVSHPFQRHIATSSEQPVLGAKGRRGRVGHAPHMMCRSNYANAGCGWLGVVKVSAGMFRFCCDIKSILYRLDKTNTHSLSDSAYLHPFELAELLGVSLRTVILRARHRPWLLPPCAEFYDRELLRWRRDIVHRWLSGG